MSQDTDAHETLVGMMRMKHVGSMLKHVGGMLVGMMRMKHMRRDDA